MNPLPEETISKSEIDQSKNPQEPERKNPSWDIKGKTVVITGATNGIGTITAKHLYLKGANIVVVGRSEKKIKETVAHLKKSAEDSKIEQPGKITCAVVDLSDLVSVRSGAQSIIDSGVPIHVLINNAGVFQTPMQKTKQGIEWQFGVNHIGHFELTRILLPRMKESQPGRIIVVSSIRHEPGVLDLEDLDWTKRTYSPSASYNQSKLANVLFANHLAKMLKDTQITVNSLHPGVIKTNLFDKQNFFVRFAVNHFIGITPEEGAQTSIHLAESDKVTGITGEYFAKSKKSKCSSRGSDEKSAQALWTASEKLIEKVMTPGADVGSTETTEATETTETTEQTEVTETTETT